MTKPSLNLVYNEKKVLSRFDIEFAPLRLVPVDMETGLNANADSTQLKEYAKKNGNWVVVDRKYGKDNRYGRNYWLESDYLIRETFATKQEAINYANNLNFA